MTFNRVYASLLCEKLQTFENKKAAAPRGAFHPDAYTIIERQELGGFYERWFIAIRHIGEGEDCLELSSVA
jgi:hypothetical protein